MRHSASNVGVKLIKQWRDKLILEFLKLKNDVVLAFCNDCTAPSRIICRDKRFLESD